jgi:hypothetical protein
LIAGAVVYHGATSTTSTDADSELKQVFVLGVGTGVSVSTLAGVAMSAIPIDGYGWIQCRGYGNVAALSGTTTAIAIGISGGALSGQMYFTNVSNGFAATAATPVRTITVLTPLTTGNVTTLLNAYIHAY